MSTTRHETIYVADCDLGRGVFATRRLRAQERILEFTGPVISLAEADAKGDTAENPLQVETELCLDLLPPAVFLNHSCAPNTGVAEGHWLVAPREIAPNEELSFDYSTTMHEDHWTMACRCDSTNCRGVVLATLMRLKQLRNHPAQWLGGGDYDSAASGKFQRLAELAGEISARQEKALVFTQFREMTGPLQHFLAGIFRRPGLVLHGGTGVKDRRGLVEQFQREDGPPFFILSLKAGGTGLTLTEAGHVIHFDRWWNPAVENQATDRAYRIGQKKNVLVHKFVCRGTVEEKIDRLIADKQ